MSQFEDIYETMLGLRILQACVPGVENAFAEGTLCDRAYEDMRRAYERLCMRLGVTDNDKDLDDMVYAMEAIQQDLCRRMYEMPGPH